MLGIGSCGQLREHLCRSFLLRYERTLSFAGFSWFFIPMTTPRRRFARSCRCAATNAGLRSRHSLNMLGREKGREGRGLQTRRPARGDEAIVLGQLCLVVGGLLGEEDGEEVELGGELRGYRNTRRRDRNDVRQCVAPP
jgi:hypothetical protein